MRKPGSGMLEWASGAYERLVDQDKSRIGPEWWTTLKIRLSEPVITYARPKSMAGQPQVPDDVKESQAARDLQEAGYPFLKASHFWRASRGAEKHGR